MTTCPGVAALSISIVNEENAIEACSCLQVSLMRHLLSWDSLFSDDFHLCQVYKTTQNQPKYFPIANINPTEHSLYYINHFYFWLNKSISCYIEWLSSSLLSRFIVWHLHQHFPPLSLQVSSYCLYNPPTVPRPHPLSPSPLSLSIKPTVYLAVLMQRFPMWLSHTPCQPCHIQHCTDSHFAQAQMPTQEFLSGTFIFARWWSNPSSPNLISQAETYNLKSETGGFIFNLL